MIEGSENVIGVRGGFIEVEGDKIIVVGSGGEVGIEIDMNRGKKGYEGGEKGLERFKENGEVKRDVDRVGGRGGVEGGKGRVKGSKRDIG